MTKLYFCFLFFFKQKTAYEMRISDWSSDVCSSDLPATGTRNSPPSPPACPDWPTAASSPRCTSGRWPRPPRPTLPPPDRSKPCAHSSSKEQEPRHLSPGPPPAFITENPPHAVIPPFFPAPTLPPPPAPPATLP